jgi:hypothetical protein
MANAVKWTFFRAGGVDQVKLETGEDLANLDQATLTSLAKVPRGSRRGRDRYAEKGLSWRHYALLATLLLLGHGWYQRTFDRFLPERVRASKVLGRFAPEKPAPARAETETALPAE